MSRWLLPAGIQDLFWRMGRAERGRAGQGRAGQGTAGRAGQSSLCKGEGKLDKGQNGTAGNRSRAGQGRAGQGCTGQSSVDHAGQGWYCPSPGAVMVKTVTGFFITCVEVKCMSSTL